MRMMRIFVTQWLFNHVNALICDKLDHFFLFARVQFGSINNGYGKILLFQCIFFRLTYKYLRKIG
jgi:hypothetical protein